MISLNTAGGSVAVPGAHGLLSLGQAAAGRFEFWGAVPLRRSGAGFVYTTAEADLDQVDGKFWPIMLSGTSLRTSTEPAELTPFSEPAANPAFIFHDAYAFPNPAKKQDVTIRAQVGLADSLEVKIYDVSGQLIHNGGFHASPQVIDDGNGKGAQYTYDYPWHTGNVGSGVYTFLITAKKAGQQDIRKTGRIGVLR